MPMKVDVELGNFTNITTNTRTCAYIPTSLSSYASIQITYPQFIKHMIITGIGYTTGIYNGKKPSMKEFYRKAIGASLYYEEFLKDFSKGRFSEPSVYDPNLKGHFSTIAGLAIADILLKQLDNVVITLKFEDVLKNANIKLKGNRADLIGITTKFNAIIAESKGGAKFNRESFCKAKYQVQTSIGTISNINSFSGIPISKGVACFSYGLYTKPRARYYDPTPHNIPRIPEKAVLDSIKDYYSGFLKICNLDIVHKTTISIRGMRFYKITPKFYPDIYWSLLCSKKIKELATLKADIIKEILNKQLFEEIKEGDKYIDRDGIGVIINDKQIITEARK